MVTFIIGGTGKSLVATGMAAQMAIQGKNPFVFHEGATGANIKAKAKKHSDVLVCWPHGVPQDVIDDPDVLLTIAHMKKTDVMLSHPLDSKLISPSNWREQDDRYGVGDYVTRHGSDIHVVVSLNSDRADAGEFKCVVAPEPNCEGVRWIEVGDIEFNTTRRYSPVDYSSWA